MDKGNHEKGYALIIVLLLIVFVSIASAVFMRGSIGNAKQEKIVDNNHLAMIAAEMGIDYYTAAIENKYTNVKDGLLSKAQIDLKNLVTSEAYKKASDQDKKIEEKKIRENIAKELKGHLAEALDIVSVPFSIDSNLKFTGENIIPTFTEDFVYIEGDVQGLNSNSKKEPILHFNVSYPIPRIIRDEGKEESEIGPNNGVPPAPPTPPNATTTWPCNNNNKNNCEKTIGNFMTVGNVSMKKGELKFEDNLVVNSLRIDGGNGADITVAKDFYIKDKLDSQTHACIAVQGNFTTLNNILSKNKLYIFVYGDAYLPSNIKLTSSNNEIFVTGDVFIDGVKQMPKKLQPVPNKSSVCSLPGPGHGGGNDGPINAGHPTFESVWDPGKIEVQYK